MSVQNKVTGLFGICSVIHLSKTKVETITLMFSVYTNGKTEGGDDDPLFSVYSLHSRSSKTVESWKSQSKFRPSLSWTLSRWEFLNIQSTFEPLPPPPLPPSTLPLLFCWPSTDSRLISANGTSHTHSSIPDHINIFSTKYFYIS